MPVSWRITNGLALLKSDEEENFEEWRACVEEALASSDYRAGMGLVHDLRRSTRIPLAGEVEARVYYAAGQMRAQGDTAVGPVVTNEAALGIVHHAVTLAESAVEIRAFRDPAEAEAWARGGAG